jgi:hypothetical protein
MRESLHTLASRRGLGMLALNGLAAFGLLSAVVQLIAAVWDLIAAFGIRGWSYSASSCCRSHGHWRAHTLADGSSAGSDIQR